MNKNQYVRSGAGNLGVSLDPPFSAAYKGPLT